jgi:hypothetical protein
MRSLCNFTHRIQYANVGWLKKWFNAALEASIASIRLVDETPYSVGVSMMYRAMSPCICQMRTRDATQGLERFHVAAAQVGMGYDGMNSVSCRSIPHQAYQGACYRL